jgi:hypothetical protein
MESNNADEFVHYNQMVKENHASYLFESAALKVQASVASLRSIDSPGNVSLKVTESSPAASTLTSIRSKHGRSIKIRCANTHSNSAKKPLPILDAEPRRNSFSAIRDSCTLF